MHHHVVTTVNSQWCPPAHSQPYTHICPILLLWVLEQRLRNGHLEILLQIKPEPHQVEVSVLASRRLFERSPGWMPGISELPHALPHLETCEVLAPLLHGGTSPSPRKQSHLYCAILPVRVHCVCSGLGSSAFVVPGGFHLHLWGISMKMAFWRAFGAQAVCDFKTA